MSSSSSSSGPAAHRGVSIVLGSPWDGAHHILPVNALRYSHMHRQLYTAGRDGVIKVWGDPTPAADTSLAPDSPQNCLHNDDDLQEQFVRLEACILGNPIRPRNIPSIPLRDHLHSYPIHSDWINDIELVNNETGLVLCSSDLSIQYTDLESKTHHSFSSSSSIHHTDYIERVRSVSSHQIITAGLDGKLLTWDLSKKCIDQQIGRDSLSSASSIGAGRLIYLLAAHHTVVAAGGPHNTIDLYDLRMTNPFIRQLIGHTGNVRCLLLNSDAVVSGSLDTLVRVWDLRTFTTRRSIQAHDAAVWLLHSTDFENIYSGDRDGNIIATSIKYATHDNHLGVLAYIHRGTTPILAIHEHALHQGIFFSDYSGVSLDLTPDLGALAHFQFLKAKTSVGKLDSSSLDLGSSSSTSTASDSVYSFHEKEANDKPAEHHTMFLETSAGGPSKEFSSVATTTAPKNYLTHAVEILVQSMEAPTRFIPFNVRPQWTVPLSPHGIVARRLLSNKRQVICQYASGHCALWDLLLCKQVKCFDNSGGIEQLAEQISTHHVHGNWAEVTIRAGRLFITVTENSIWHLEIYVDELLGEYTQIKGIGDKSDYRVAIGAILIKSLLKGYMQEQQQKPKKPSSSSSSSSDKTRTTTITKNTADLRNLRSVIRKYQPGQGKPPDVDVLACDNTTPYIHDLPRDILVLITESLLALGNARQLCCFTLASLGEQIALLHRNLPLWLTAPLLHDDWRGTLRDSAPRILFLLREMKGNDKRGRSKPLPNLKGTSKLISHHMLRGQKILRYVVDNFESKTSEMKAKREPLEWLVLECRGQEIDLLWTLLSIKQQVWKANNEIEIGYRRRIGTA